jgi:putative protease
MEPVPWLDEVCREVDHDRLDPLVEAGRPCGVGNVSELVLARERGALAGGEAVHTRAQPQLPACA